MSNVLEFELKYYKYFVFPSFDISIISNLIIAEFKGCYFNYLGIRISLFFKDMIASGKRKQEFLTYINFIV